MKTRNTCFAMIISAVAVTANANDSVHHSGQASKHSALATSEGVASTGRVASAVVAVPVVLTAGVSIAAGSAVVASGEHLAESAQHSHGPLIITDTVITVDPAPNQVVTIQAQQR